MAEHTRSAARGSRGGQGGTARLAIGIRDDRSLGSGGWLHANGSRVRSGPGVRFYFDAHQVLIGNFPAEVSVLAALLEILLEKDGASGIGDENSGGGQKNIAGAILHFHPPTQKGGVASHAVLSVVRGR